MVCFLSYCITELIANDQYKGLSHSALGPAGVNCFKSCSLLETNVFLGTFVSCSGDILTKLIVRHFGLMCIICALMEALVGVKGNCQVTLLFHGWVVHIIVSPLLVDSH